MKSYDEIGSAFLSPVRSAMLHTYQQTTRSNLGHAGVIPVGYKTTAFMKPRPAQTENNPMPNGKSEAQKSYSDTLLRLSVVVNEGNWAVALTEVTAQKTKLLRLEQRIFACYGNA